MKTHANGAVPSAIGIFGGTFDPPHFGHLIIAEHVRTGLGLEKMVFVPGQIPPHKQHRKITAATDRLEMLRLALEGNPAFLPAELEVRRGGVSYTVDTLTELSREYRGRELVFLIGADNVVEFRTWKEPDTILRLARLAVVRRPGIVLEPEHLSVLGGAARVIDVPEIGISSRMIRERVAHELSIRYLVPEAVREYIVTHGLYGGRRT